jgi:phenylacetate-CoA ligase
VSKINISKLIRINTVSISLEKLLENQLKFMLSIYDVTAISSDKERLEKFGENQKVATFHLELTRKITLVKNMKAVICLVKFLKKEQPFLVHTHTPKAGILSKTGGTTGKSLEVLFTRDNMQGRFIMLDNFIGRFGYKLEKKTAWFSGKNILKNKDVKKNRFWKTDNLHNVRYYSTFYLKETNLR